MTGRDPGEALPRSMPYGILHDPVHGRMDPHTPTMDHDGMEPTPTCGHTQHRRIGVD